MNTAQKIIKYFAIAFASLLSVSIIAGIVFGCLGILTATKLIKDNSSVAITCEENESPCLKITLGVSDLEIKKGDKLSAETSYEKISINQEDGRLVITENGGSIFDDASRKITVYVPEDMELSKVGIAGGAGSINVESLKAKDMEVSLGVGETVFNKLEVENAKINAGIGRIEINLASSNDDYAIKASRGIGDITLNGAAIKSDEWMGSGNKKIEISGGIGEITIKTNQE